MPRAIHLAPAILLVAAFLAGDAQAASGGTLLQMTHSGYLLDASDQPLSSTLSMKFRILDALSAGLLEWEGTCASVLVSGGYYAVVLGSAECVGTATGELDPALDSSDLPPTAPRWLEVVVGTVVMAPRVAISLAPAAVLAKRALDADTVGGHPAGDFALTAHRHPASAIDGFDEADPKVGTLVEGQWCTAIGGRR